MKTFGSVSALSWLVMLAGTTALAPATKAQSRCPLITVSCPSEAKDGEPIIFSATVKDADPTVRLTYSWTVAGGTIIEGQGTPTIKLKPAGDSTWTGRIVIGGLDSSCSSTASCSLVVCRAPVSKRFASYEARSGDEEIKWLASFADELKNQGGSQAYIFSFARRGGAADETKASVYRAKTYLVGEQGIEGDRIVTLERGFKDQLTIELWVVPPGAALPKAAEEPKQTAKSPRSP